MYFTKKKEEEGRKKKIKTDLPPIVGSQNLIFFFNQDLKFRVNIVSVGDESKMVEGEHLG